MALKGVKGNKCFRDITIGVESSTQTISSIASGAVESAVFEYPAVLPTGTVAVANIEASGYSAALWGVSMCTYIVNNTGSSGTDKAAVLVYIKNDTGVNLNGVTVRVALLPPSLEAPQETPV